MHTTINGVDIDNATLRELKRLPTDQLLERANILVGGYGVEYISHRNDTMRDRLGLEYVNLGDTYDVTFVWDHNLGRLRITSWGDIVERAREGVYR
jgi:hypothetical protein